MEDIIRLLPDAVANQIAAGEVIQRPASVVKELLENAVDAGAGMIQLIVKDSGKTLIQVVDNGKGMSFNDARLCFERHATSKLAKADDLFHISTKGFRGEALASIAAIAHVELKTKQTKSEMGTFVRCEGSEIKEHTLASTPDGTSIAVKNLFYNVPARRNFLKSDKIEFAHIEEELFRVALIHHDIAFSLYHNGRLELQLPACNFRQRIVNIFGQHFNDKLLPVELDHDLMHISGFIAKPEKSKKQKSEQYMFINQRFVRHPLLNFAVEKAYAELIPHGYHPAYFIAITIDPQMIDVNVSPTKVEVKLQDERLFFGFLNSAVKKALGTMSLTPMIDFDESNPFKIADAPPDREITAPGISVNPNYNPFNIVPEKSHVSPFHNFAKKDKTGSSNADWSEFFKNLNSERLENQSFEQKEMDISDNNSKDVQDLDDDFPFFVVQNRYMIFRLNGQVAAADLPNLHERLLFDRYQEALSTAPIIPQKSLFPATVTLTVAQTDLAVSLKEEFLRLGYELEKIDGTHIAVNATPSNDDDADVQSVIEAVLATWQAARVVQNTDKFRSMALGMARQKRSRQRVPVDAEEAKALICRLFDSSSPMLSPSGKNILHIFTINELCRFFD